MLLVKALEIAERAHRGQLDKGGRDYFTAHILAVVSKVDGKARIVAALHDTVEDTPVTLGYIRAEFGDEVADAVDALTHRKGEDYFDYIERVKQNELARAVKLADLENNMDLSRIPSPSEKDFERIEKYKKAKAVLEG